MSCCATITPDDADRLAIVGGSPNPYSEPYGQLRVCRTCGRRFLYTHDHDNEAGYFAMAKTLDPMSPEHVRTYLPRAIAVAEHQRAYFLAKGDARVAAEYEAEVQRLTSEG